MSDVKLTNIPSMTVGKAVDKLSHAYTTVIQNRLPVKTMPSVMLWGPPGVGKSQAIRQIAKKIEDSTGKSVNVTDVRLLLFNPIDLRGIPTSNADKTLAVWLKPQIFQMDSDDNIVNILFLDEISAAPQSVQAAAYQITLDRVVGEHKLPDNCIVIAAGNRDGNLHNQSSLNNAIHRIRRDCNDEILLNRKTDKEPVLLPYFTCHHLRHTFATRLCESGINIKVIQNVLGHVDISTTMNIYIDVTNDLKKEEMLTYAKFVGNSKGEIETAV